jgi:hypothetical protein
MHSSRAGPSPHRGRLCAGLNSNMIIFHSFSLSTLRYYREYYSSNAHGTSGPYFDEEKMETVFEAGEEFKAKKFCDGFVHVSDTSYRHNKSDNLYYKQEKHYKAPSFETIQNDEKSEKVEEKGKENRQERRRLPA